MHMPAPYEKLRVWQLAHQLALEIYRITASFPATERYGLASQMRRAATAIATNIVEGNARNHRGEYVQFCHIARSSAVELKYLLQLSRDLRLLRSDEFTSPFNLANVVSALLYTMVSRLAAKPN